MRVGSSNPASTSSKSPRKGISPTSIRYLALGDCGILLANLAAALFCIGPRRERCTVIDAVDHRNKWVVAEAGVAVVERFRGDVGPVPFFQRLIDQTAANLTSVENVEEYREQAGRPRRPVLPTMRKLTVSKSPMSGRRTCLFNGIWCNLTHGKAHKQASRNQASRRRRGSLPRIQDSAAARSVYEQEWFSRVLGDRIQDSQETRS